MTFKHFVVSALATFVSFAALAGEPIDFGRHILDLDDKDIPSGPEKGAKPLDLATVAGMALLTEQPADPRNPAAATRDPNEKLKRFALAMKVHKPVPVSLTAEEIALLKEAIGQSYPPLVVGRADAILDPPPAAAH